MLFRYKEKEKIALCILSTFLQPTGLLWQEGPLLWVHPRASPAKSIDHYSTAITKLTLLEIQQCLQFFEKNLTSLIISYTASQVQILCRTINDWVILHCCFDGLIDNHYPRHPLLSFFKEHPVVFPKVTAQAPLPGAPNIFTDGSKTGCGACMIEHNEPVLCQYQPGSSQVVKLQIMLKVFK